MARKAPVQIRQTDVFIALASGSADVLEQYRVLSHIQAREAGEQFAADFASQFAGSTFVIPKDRIFMTARRDAALMKDFTGFNQIELAHKYKLATSTVYEIIANYRSRKQKEVQRCDLLVALIGSMTLLLCERYDVPKPQAAQAGNAVADFIATELGGILLALPNDYCYRTARRDVALLRGFRGDNHAELADEHGLSLDDVHTILGGYRNIPLRTEA